MNEINPKLHIFIFNYNNTCVSLIILDMKRLGLYGIKLPMYTVVVSLVLEVSRKQVYDTL